MLYSCSIITANIESGEGVIFYLDSTTTLTTTATIKCNSARNGADYTSERSAKIILIGI